LVIFDIIRRKLKQLAAGELRTARSARKRLRRIHAAYGFKNIEIKEQVGPLDEVKAFTASGAAIEEAVEDLSSVESEVVNADAAELQYLFQAFLGTILENWTVADLDRVFKAWHQSAHRGRFSPHVVMRITGAAFGNHCNAHLQMRWVAITDALGRDAAVRSLDNLVTGFPFSTVKKRIDANETGFFVPVFEHLRESIAEASSKEK
jgi:hypothetical protein